MADTKENLENDNVNRIIISDEQDLTAFPEAVSTVKIPVLILDQKWHRLFALGGKPESVKSLEAELGEYLKRQGEINNLLVDVKKVKSDLMKQVVSNMDGATDGSDAESTRRLDDNKRLLEEAKVKIEELEDEILEIPHSIDEVNRLLMLETMNYCYSKLRTNTKEANEITEWIKTMRVELKKNLIKKQNREINNREIYSYMHDIFGPEILEIFDVKYKDFDLDAKDSNPEGEK